MYIAVALAVLLGAAEPPAGSTTPPPDGTAASPAAEHARSIPPEVVAEEEPSPKLIGVQLSVGVPDGFGVGAFVRPLPWLRVDGGVAYNVLAFGLQGGVTFMPWPGSITPTLRLGVGQYFESDVRDEVGEAFPDSLDPALAKWGYHFYTAQLGLEMGDDNGPLFFVRGGLAWIRSDLERTTFQEGDTTVTTDRSDLSATTPSVQLGLLWHLW
jgi:hypothetical protein